MKLSEFSKKYGDREINEVELKKALNIKGNKRWQPKKNEKYYYVTVNGAIDSFKWDGFLTDKYCYTTHNCFKTTNEAVFESERRKVVGELKTFAIENNECEINWEDEGQAKWFLYYNLSREKIDIDCADIRYKCNNIYFSSKELAEQAINTIGEDRLKKYYFEVKEKENC